MNCSGVVMCLPSQTMKRYTFQVSTTRTAIKHCFKWLAKEILNVSHKKKR